MPHIYWKRWYFTVQANEWWRQLALNAEGQDPIAIAVVQDFLRELDNYYVMHLSGNAHTSSTSWSIHNVKRFLPLFESIKNSLPTLTTSPTSSPDLQKQLESEIDGLFP